MAAMAGNEVTRYDRYLTVQARKREPSAIRSLLKHMSKPNAISLGGGMPNPDTFPITKLSFTMLSPEGDEVEMNIDNISETLQYTPSAGLPALVKLLGDFQDHFHSPPAKCRENRGIFVSTGSQDAVTKALECLVETTDTILVEDVTYSSVLSFLKAHGCKMAPVKTDWFGLVPSELDTMLSSWTQNHPDQPKPKVLYVIPTGSNPRGTSLSKERRHELYAVACKHDLLILEDDPYYFMQYCDDKDWLPSLYSMDVEERVVRFDSFSKIIAAGLRIGFMTGPKQIIDRVLLMQQVTELHTSGVSQSIVYAMLQKWQFDGFRAHVRHLANFYMERRDALYMSIDTHLPGEMISLAMPDAGMFIWLKLDFVKDTRTFAKELVEDLGILVVAGHCFSSTSENIPFVRLSYSLAAEGDMDNAMLRLGEALRKYDREHLDGIFSMREYL